MKKKIYIILGSVIFLFSAHYYWQNRYVKLRPVLPREVINRPVFFSNLFHNQLYRIASPNEVSQNYYKNIRYVLERSGQEYIMKNGNIYIKFKYVNDMEMIWNYTTRATDPHWFKLKREMDSVNGDIEEKEELDRIIKGFLK
ncbi:hypothetical protein [Flavobacterium sp. DG2-3]|uniref:hypothetical protein n=1 Tax=Flavobacterium sp. DG2-3 TaxID=3068317 RepID=UPI0027401B62|nr:hypothetical protein [Flavobacterium sp. DG2-3]MDP5199100.1 hypothetical protein [Flavobacterium sp. DG2-3]